MYYRNRQLEKNKYFVDFVMNHCGYKHFYDLSYYEEEKKALEGRGVLIYDYKEMKFYAGESNRVNTEVLHKFVEILNSLAGKEVYSYYIIYAWDEKQKSIPFHTSCYMQIFKTVAFVNWTSIRDEKQI